MHKGKKYVSILHKFISKTIPIQKPQHSSKGKTKYLLDNGGKNLPNKINEEHEVNLLQQRSDRPVDDHYNMLMQEVGDKRKLSSVWKFSWTKLSCQNENHYDNMDKIQDDMRMWTADATDKGERYKENYIGLLKENLRQGMELETAREEAFKDVNLDWLGKYVDENCTAQSVRESIKVKKPNNNIEKVLNINSTPLKEQGNKHQLECSSGLKSSGMEKTSKKITTKKNRA